MQIPFVTSVLSTIAELVDRYYADRDRKRLRRIRPARPVIDPRLPRIDISIARDFSPCPGGRYLADGPRSGELFRHDVLAPALRKEDSVVRVIFDGHLSMSAAWIDEAFGGLLSDGFSAKYIYEHLEINYDNPRFIADEYLLWSYVDAHAGGELR